MRRTAMKSVSHCSARHLVLTLSTLCIATAAVAPASASEFSVTPIRAELKPGALSETITVTNHASARLRVAVKLVEWTQDATGKDIYRDSNDLVYFPRQLELPPDSKRLVRVGLKVPAGVVERTYRLFIEEQPEPVAASGQSQVAFYFRFGVPIFVAPAVPKAQPEVLEPTLTKGKLALVVRNRGNHHFRLTKVTVSDGGDYVKELQGWYSLAGSERTYADDVPPVVCQQAKTLSMALEGEGIRIERQLHVDPASCL